MLWTGGRPSGVWGVVQGRVWRRGPRNVRPGAGVYGGV